jgi:DNA-binding NarL/FixJ family response regulator
VLHLDGPASAGEAAPGRVLVVEDHHLLGQLMVHQLEREGIGAEQAPVGSAQEVVAAAHAEVYAVVLLDLALGGTVGDAVPLIGPLRRTGAQVVMLTGVTDRHRHAECVEAGAVGVTMKDRRVEEVIAELRRVMTTGSLLAPGERDELLARLRGQRQERERRLAPFTQLTAREQQVLAALMAGRTAPAIAREWVVSYETVRTQIRTVLAKLGVHSQLEAVALARRAGWRPAEPDTPVSA